MLGDPLDGLQRVLVVTAHYDDLEYNAGGLVARLQDDDVAVQHLLVAWSVSYRRWDGTPRTLKSVEKDAARARELLGYETEVLRMGKETEDVPWPVDVLPADNEMVHKVEERLREYDPDLVVVQSPFSTHPGHRNVAETALAATRRHKAVLSVEPFAPDRRVVPFRPNVYVRLNQDQVDRKVAALSCFERSCGVTNADLQTVRALARVRGHEAGVDWAEAYEVVRWTV